MSGISRWADPDRFTSTGSSRNDRAVSRANSEIAAAELIERRLIEKEVRLAAHMAAGVAGYTVEAMKYVLAVDRARQAQAGENPGHNALLGRLVFNCLQRVEGIQDNLLKRRFSL